MELERLPSLAEFRQISLEIQDIDNRLTDLENCQFFDDGRGFIHLSEYTVYLLAKYGLMEFINNFHRDCGDLDAFVWKDNHTYDIVITKRKELQDDGKN